MLDLTDTLHTLGVFADAVVSVLRFHRLTGLCAKYPGWNLQPLFGIWRAFPIAHILLSVKLIPLRFGLLKIPASMQAGLIDKVLEVINWPGISDQFLLPCPLIFDGLCAKQLPTKLSPLCFARWKPLQKRDKHTASNDRVARALPSFFTATEDVDEP